MPDSAIKGEGIEFGLRSSTFATVCGEAREHTRVSFYVMEYEGS